MNYCVVEILLLRRGKICTACLNQMPMFAALGNGYLMRVV